MTIKLENNWKFCLGEVRRWERVDHNIAYMTTKTGWEVGDMRVFLEQNPWREVAVPHDWNTEQRSTPEGNPSHGFKPRGIGWYWTEFELPETRSDDCVLIEFEGVMGESVVYVNGALVARNESGYTGFTTDISDYVLSGEKNTVVVSVDTTRWEGWWYEGAGIYRPVNVFVLPETHFRPKGIFARPVKTETGWQVNASFEVEGSAEYTVEARIFAPDGQEVGSAVTNTAAEIAVNAPELWSPETPALYTLESRLLVGGECVQTERTRFGFREVVWTDHGMFLNGRRTFVAGACCHQDHVGVGIAMPRSVLRYRLAQLKAMGCNAYRCSHNCPSKDLLELCDEMGMLVMAENRHFRSTEEVMKQLDELVYLCRNHPSVFLYSLFNEEPWQKELRGRRIAEKMLKRVRMNDDSRAVTAAMDGGSLTKENASDVLDVAGLNYHTFDYEKYAERCPGKPMIGSENGPIYATRGIYKDDEKAQVYNSYGLTNAYFGQTLQDTIEAIDKNPQVAGLFLWGAIEYRGEPQPYEWPSVFSHWGLLDNCAFEKDTFYMTKSYYNAPEDLMLHLLPHWNWQAGEIVRVCAMTNCETAQLFVNGKPLEKKQVVRNRAEWEVPFEAGRIEAAAEKDGRVLTDAVVTTGEPAALEVIDAADTRDYDCSILNVRLRDAEGRPTAIREHDREIHFIVKRGTLIGAGNGNPNGQQPDVTDAIETFCGRCQALVRPDESGKIEVLVCCEDMEEVRVTR